MKKKIALISRDSIFAGVLLSKTCEFIDSLANALSSQYDVYVLALDSDMKSFARKTATVVKVDEAKSKIKFSKVNYFLIKSDYWNSEVVNILNDLKPEIIHNFSESHFINELTYEPQKTIYTFNYIEDIENKDDLNKYDIITTTSITYANLIKDQIEVIGLPSGLLKNVFTPNKGFLLTKSFSKNEQDNKQICKRMFLQKHGIEGDPCVFLIAGLHPEKNLKEIVNAIPLIQENGGVIVIATKSNVFYNEQLLKYNKSDGVIYFAKYPSMIQIPTLLSACDFYLHPKSRVTGNFFPMLASNYGGIPILALDKHNSQDYFNKENAIIVNDNLNDKILEAFELYNNKDELKEKRFNTMDSVPDWKESIHDWILLYEA